MFYALKLVISFVAVAILLVGLSNTAYKLFTGDDSVMLAVFTWAVVLPSSIFVALTKQLFKYKKSTH